MSQKIGQILDPPLALIRNLHQLLLDQCHLHLGRASLPGVQTRGVLQQPEVATSGSSDVPACHVFQHCHLIAMRLPEAMEEVLLPGHDFNLGRSHAS